eukprot:g3865.t1
MWGCLCHHPITGITIVKGQGTDFYKPGVYKNVKSYSSGSGKDSIFDVTINNDGTIGSITIVEGGKGYRIGDVINLDLPLRNAMTSIIKVATIGDNVTCEPSLKVVLKLAAISSGIDDFYVGRILTMTTGVATGERVTILKYNAATKEALVTPQFSRLPNSSDEYTINGGSLLLIKLNDKLGEICQLNSNVVIEVNAKFLSLPSSLQISEEKCFSSSATTVECAKSSTFDSSRNNRCGLSKAFHSFVNCSVKDINSNDTIDVIGFSLSTSKEIVPLSAISTAAGVNYFRRDTPSSLTSNSNEKIVKFFHAKLETNILLHSPTKRMYLIDFSFMTSSTGILQKNSSITIESESKIFSTGNAFTSTAVQIKDDNCKVSSSSCSSESYSQCRQRNKVDCSVIKEIDLWNSSKCKEVGKGCHYSYDDHSCTDICSRVLEKEACLATSGGNICEFVSGVRVKFKIDDKPNKLCLIKASSPFQFTIKGSNVLMPLNFNVPLIMRVKTDKDECTKDNEASCMQTLFVHRTIDEFTMTGQHNLQSSVFFSFQTSMYGQSLKHKDSILISTNFSLFAVEKRFTIKILGNGTPSEINACSNIATQVHAPGKRLEITLPTSCSIQAGSRVYIELSKENMNDHFNYNEYQIFFTVSTSVDLGGLSNIYGYDIKKTSISSFSATPSTYVEQKNVEWLTLSFKVSKNGALRRGSLIFLKTNHDIFTKKAIFETLTFLEMNTSCSASAVAGTSNGRELEITLSGDSCKVQENQVVKLKVGGALLDSGKIQNIGGTTSFTVAASAEAVAKYYSRLKATIVVNGESRLISDYSSSRVVTIEKAFTKTIAINDDYKIYASGLEPNKKICHVHKGTIASKTSNVLFQLHTSAEQIDGFYVGTRIRNDKNEERTIVKYTSTRYVTINQPFVNAIGTGQSYEIADRFEDDVSNTISFCSEVVFTSVSTTSDRIPLLGGCRDRNIHSRTACLSLHREVLNQFVYGSVWIPMGYTIQAESVSNFSVAPQFYGIGSNPGNITVKFTPSPLGGVLKKGDVIEIESNGPLFCTNFSCNAVVRNDVIASITNQSTFTLGPKSRKEAHFYVGTWIVIGKEFRYITTYTIDQVVTVDLPFQQNILSKGTSYDIFGRDFFGKIVNDGGNTTSQFKLGLGTFGDMIHGWRIAAWSAKGFALGTISNNSGNGVVTVSPNFSSIFDSTGGKGFDTITNFSITKVNNLEGGETTFNDATCTSYNSLQALVHLKTTDSEFEAVVQHYLGNEITWRIFDESLEDCKARCSIDVECIGFNYKDDGGSFCEGKKIVDVANLSLKADNNLTGYKKKWIHHSVVMQKGTNAFGWIAKTNANGFSVNIESFCFDDKHGCFNTSDEVVTAKARGVYVAIVSTGKGYTNNSQETVIFKGGMCETMPVATVAIVNNKVASVSMVQYGTCSILPEAIIRKASGFGAQLKVLMSNVAQVSGSVMVPSGSLLAVHVNAPLSASQAPLEVEVEKDTIVSQGKGQGKVAFTTKLHGNNPHIVYVNVTLGTFQSNRDILIEGVDRIPSLLIDAITIRPHHSMSIVLDDKTNNPSNKCSVDPSAKVSQSLVIKSKAMKRFATLPNREFLLQMRTTIDNGWSLNGGFTVAYSHVDNFSCEINHVPCVASLTAPVLRADHNGSCEEYGKNLASANKSFLTLKLGSHQSSGYYKDLFFRITSGLGKGQYGIISNYNHSNRKADIGSGLASNIDTSSTYVINVLGECFTALTGAHVTGASGANAKVCIGDGAQGRVWRIFRETCTACKGLGKTICDATEDCLYLSNSNECFNTKCSVCGTVGRQWKSTRLKIGFQLSEMGNLAANDEINIAGRLVQGFKLYKPLAMTQQPNEFFMERNTNGVYVRLEDGFTDCQANFGKIVTCDTYSDDERKCQTSQCVYNNETKKCTGTKSIAQITLNDGSGKTCNVPVQSYVTLKIGGEDSVYFSTSFDNSAVQISTNDILIDSVKWEKLTNGVPVVYISSGSTIAPLVDGKTYFVIKSSPNHIQLATAKVFAIKLNPIIFTNVNGSGGQKLEGWYDREIGKSGDLAPFLTSSSLTFSVNTTKDQLPKIYDQGRFRCDDSQVSNVTIIPITDNAGNRILGVIPEKLQVSFQTSSYGSLDFGFTITIVSNVEVFSFTENSGSALIKIKNYGLVGSSSDRGTGLAGCGSQSYQVYENGKVIVIQFNDSKFTNCKVKPNDMCTFTIENGLKPHGAMGDVTFSLSTSSPNEFFGGDTKPTTVVGYRIEQQLSSATVAVNACVLESDGNRISSFEKSKCIQCQVEDKKQYSDGNCAVQRKWLNVTSIPRKFSPHEIIITVSSTNILSKADSDTITITTSLSTWKQTQPVVAINNSNSVTYNVPNGQTPITPLSSGTSYFLFRSETANRVKLATTKSNALNGTAIVLSGSPTGTHTLVGKLVEAEFIGSSIGGCTLSATGTSNEQNLILVLSGCTQAYAAGQKKIKIHSSCLKGDYNIGDDLRISTIETSKESTLPISNLSWTRRKGVYAKKNVDSITFSMEVACSPLCAAQSGRITASLIKAETIKIIATSPIFKVNNATALTFGNSNNGNCTLIGKSKTFFILEITLGGNSCVLHGTIAITVGRTNLLFDTLLPVQITFSVETSKDTKQVSLVGRFDVIDSQVTNASVLPTTRFGEKLVKIGSTPSLLRVQFQTSKNGSMKKEDRIVVVSSHAAFMKDEVNVMFTNGITNCSGQVIVNNSKCYGIDQSRAHCNSCKGCTEKTDCKKNEECLGNELVIRLSDYANRVCVVPADTASEFWLAGGLARHENQRADIMFTLSTTADSQPVSAVGYTVGNVINTGEVFSTHFGQLLATGTKTNGKIGNNLSWVVGKTIVFTEGTGSGQSALISDYNSSSGVATFSDFLLVAGDTNTKFYIQHQPVHAKTMTPSGFLVKLNTSTMGALTKNDAIFIKGNYSLFSSSGNVSAVIRWSSQKCVVTTTKEENNYAVKLVLPDPCEVPAGARVSVEIQSGLAESKTLDPGEAKFDVQLQVSTSQDVEKVEIQGWNILDQSVTSVQVGCLSSRAAEAIQKLNVQFKIVEGLSVGEKIYVRSNQQLFEEGYTFTASFTNQPKCQGVGIAISENDIEIEIAGSECTIADNTTVAIVVESETKCPGNGFFSSNGACCKPNCGSGSYCYVGLNACPPGTDDNCCSSKIAERRIPCDSIVAPGIGCMLGKIYSFKSQPPAGDVKFQIKTSQELTFSNLVTGYTVLDDMVDNLNVTVKNRVAGMKPEELRISFISKKQFSKIFVEGKWEGNGNIIFLKGLDGCKYFVRVISAILEIELVECLISGGVTVEFKIANYGQTNNEVIGTTLQLKLRTNGDTAWAAPCQDEMKLNRSCYITTDDSVDNFTITRNGANNFLHFSTSNNGKLVHGDKIEMDLVGNGTFYTENIQRIEIIEGSNGSCFLAPIILAKKFTIEVFNRSGICNLEGDVKLIIKQLFDETANAQTQKAYTLKIKTTKDSLTENSNNFIALPLARNDKGYRCGPLGSEFSTHTFKDLEECRNACESFIECVAFEYENGGICKLFKIIPALTILNPPGCFPIFDLKGIPSSTARGTLVTQPNTGSYGIVLGQAPSPAGLITNVMNVKGLLQTPLYIGGVLNGSATIEVSKTCAMLAREKGCTSMTERDTIGWNGLVIEIEELNPGTVYNTGVKSTTGGSGKNLTVEVLTIAADGKIDTIKIVNKGYDYALNDVIAITGAGTSGTVATFKVVKINTRACSDIALTTREKCEVIEGCIWKSATCVAAATDEECNTGIWSPACTERECTYSNGICSGLSVSSCNDRGGKKACSENVGCVWNEGSYCNKRYTLLESGAPVKKCHVLPSSKIQGEKMNSLTIVTISSVDLEPNDIITLEFSFNLFKNVSNSNVSVSLGGTAGAGTTTVKGTGENVGKILEITLQKQIIKNVETTLLISIGGGGANNNPSLSYIKSVAYKCRTSRNMVWVNGNWNLTGSKFSSTAVTPSTTQAHQLMENLVITVTRGSATAVSLLSIRTEASFFEGQALISATSGFSNCILTSSITDLTLNISLSNVSSATCTLQSTIVFKIIGGMGKLGDAGSMAMFLSSNADVEETKAAVVVTDSSVRNFSVASNTTVSGINPSQLVFTFVHDQLEKNDQITISSSRTLFPFDLQVSNSTCKLSISSLKSTDVTLQLGDCVLSSGSSSFTFNGRFEKNGAIGDNSFRFTVRTSKDTTPLNASGWLFTGTSVRNFRIVENEIQLEIASQLENGAFIYLRGMNLEGTPNIELTMGWPRECKADSKIIGNIAIINLNERCTVKANSVLHFIIHEPLLSFGEYSLSTSADIEWKLFKLQKNQSSTGQVNNSNSNSSTNSSVTNNFITWKKLKKVTILKKNDAFDFEIESNETPNQLFLKWKKKDFLNLQLEVSINVASCSAIIHMAESLITIDLIDNIHTNQQCVLPKLFTLTILGLDEFVFDVYSDIDRISTEVQYISPPTPTPAVIFTQIVNKFKAFSAIIDKNTTGDLPKLDFYFVVANTALVAGDKFTISGDAFDIFDAGKTENIKLNEMCLAIVSAKSKNALEIIIANASSQSTCSLIEFGFTCSLLLPNGESNIVKLHLE